MLNVVADKLTPTEMFELGAWTYDLVSTHKRVEILKAQYKMSFSQAYQN
jgi:hypothetical protein